LTNQVFLELLEMAENDHTLVKEVEAATEFCSANHAMNTNDSADQQTAQYGWISWDAFPKVAKAINLQSHDT
jgi:hypothetical protein